MVITIGAHWSPLELEIAKRDNAELIQMVITIGAHWSPMELEIEKRDNAELILIGITIGVHKGSHFHSYINLESRIFK